MIGRSSIAAWRSATSSSVQAGDYVKVANASLENGLLAIELAREIPEEMKPRRIAISSAVSIEGSGRPEQIGQDIKRQA